jgi:hypothetical protein
MSTIRKSLNELKDSERMKEQLISWPPIPYVPPMDLVTAKESPESLKIKLSGGTVLNMSIISRRNTEEYLAHVIAVLCLINQKGLNVQSRKLAKVVDKLFGTLENLQQPTGPKGGASSKEDQASRKLGILYTQAMLKEAQKAQDKAVAKTYELLRNLLFSDPQSQWDWVCREMHKRDLWAEVNGKVTKGRRPCTWAAFQDCLELHKLKVFTDYTAKRQWF